MTTYNGQRNRIYYKLIDLEAVVLPANANSTEIAEPQGLGTLPITLSRPPEQRGGAMFEFGEAETAIGFYLYGPNFDGEVISGGYALVTDIIDLRGQDAKMRVEVYREETNATGTTTQLLYSGDLIAKSYVDDTPFARFNVKRVDFNNAATIRNSVPINPRSKTDVFGNNVPVTDFYRLALHSRTDENNGRQQVKDSQFYNDPLVNPLLSRANGSLWANVEFNTEIIALPQAQQLFNSFYYLNSVFANDQEQYATLNPLVLAQRYIYKATALVETVDIDLQHEFTFRIETESTNTIGQRGPFNEIKSNRVIIWRVNNGVFIDVLATPIIDIVNTSVLEETRIINYQATLNLNRGDEIYYSSTWGISSVTSDNYFNLRTLQASTGLLNFTVQSRTEATISPGMFTADLMNSLLRRIVGPPGVTELTLFYFGVSGAFVVGEVVTGQTSGATGIIYQNNIGGSTQPNLVVVDQKGAFITGEVIESGGVTATCDLLDIGELYDSSISNSLSDIAGAQFFTNGNGIRNFIAEDYDAANVYASGDYVVFDGDEYKYINSQSTAGNEPPNATYWVLEEGPQFTISLAEVTDFLMYRYGAGLNLEKRLGIDGGTVSTQMVSRYVIELFGEFFRDVEILSIDAPKLNPIKEFNPVFDFSQIQTGYTLYERPNETRTIGGYLTERVYLSNLAEATNPLDLRADVIASGNEIERARRNQRKDAPNERDEKDEKPFVIDCIAITESNPWNPATFGNDIDKLGLFFDPTAQTIDIRGRIVPQISVGDKLAVIQSPSVTLYYEVSGLFLDFEQDKTVLDIVAPFLVAGPSFARFYLADNSETSKTVMVPTRNEFNNGVTNIVDAFTEFNQVHQPTTILRRNYPWFGSGLTLKNGYELVRYASGVNNDRVVTEEIATTENPNPLTVAENQDFSITLLNGQGTPIFTPFQYTLEAKLNYDDFTKLRLSLLNQEGATDYGYISFNYKGQTVQAYPMELTYDSSNSAVTVVCWERNV